MSLSVVPELVPMLDAVVLSLVILDQERREQGFHQGYSATGAMGSPTIVA